MSAALKRVAQLVAGATPVASAVIKVSYADLRAVLALAKESVELKRRIRLARDVFEGRRAVYDSDSLDTRDAGLADLLYLRKPLPKARRR